MRTAEVDRWGGCLRAPLNASRVWVLCSQDSGIGAPRDSSPGPWGSLNNGVRAAQSRSPELPQRPPRNQVANVTLKARRSGPFPDRSEPAPFPATSPISSHPHASHQPRPRPREGGGATRPRPKGNLVTPPNSCQNTLKAWSPPNSKQNKSTSKTAKPPSCPTTTLAAGVPRAGTDPQSFPPRKTTEL